MITSNVHIEYVVDTNTALYQAYKDSNTIYLHFQESYERLTKATSYSEWVKEIEQNLTTKEGEELLNAIDRLSKLNGAYPKPIQTTNKTFPNGDVGTGDFFQKPVNVYIYKPEIKTSSSDSIVIEKPKIIVKEEVFKPVFNLDISQISNVSKNYGKLWKSSLSGYIPSSNDGEYYYLVILKNGERFVLTIKEYKDLLNY